MQQMHNIDLRPNVGRQITPQAVSICKQLFSHSIALTPCSDGNQHACASSGHRWRLH